MRRSAGIAEIGAFLRILLVLGVSFSEVPGARDDGWEFPHFVLVGLGSPDCPIDGVELERARAASPLINHLRESRAHFSLRVELETLVNLACCNHSEEAIVLRVIYSTVIVFIKM
jgi:hypothetical protein